MTLAARYHSEGLDEQRPITEATTTYSYAWTHTDASSGKAVTDQAVSQTTWVRQADDSWKNVADLNAVYPDPAAPSR